MSIKSHTISIGDDSYSFITFPATKGLSILTKLLKVVGPAFGKFISSEEVKEGEEDTSFSNAVSILVENMYKDDITGLVKIITSNVTKNGVPIDFDQDFAGNYGVMVQLLVEILKANYSSFFTENGISGILKLIPKTQ